MKKYILITALCLLKVGHCISATKPPINFTTKPCARAESCLEIFINKRFIGKRSVGRVHYYYNEKNSLLSVGLITVDPDYRHRGIGTALLRTLEKETQCKEIRLHSVTSAVHFYEKLGFTCNEEFRCSKPCNQSSLPEPAQTSRLGSQNPKSNGGIQ